MGLIYDDPDLAALTPTRLAAEESEGPGGLDGRMHNYLDELVPRPILSPCTPVNGVRTGLAHDLAWISPCQSKLAPESVRKRICLSGRARPALAHPKHT
jgi:hypothetical protein